MQEPRRKIVWITGASSGIGRALANYFAQNGWIIAATARSLESLKQIATKQIFIYVGDVTNREQMKMIALQIEEDLGPIDLLIANAGTYIPTNAKEFNAQEYEQIMQVNFTGVINCIQAVLPQMLKSGSGHIAGMSSLVGYRGLPRAAAYGASKAALNNFIEGMRFDLIDSGVALSVICPGFVKTPLTDKNDFPMPFLISVEEAAEIIYRGLAQQKRQITFPLKLAWIFKLLRIIPFGLYHWVISKTVVRK